MLKPIIIQDIILVATLNSETPHPTGEFGSTTTLNGKSVLADENSEHMIKRLFQSITEFITQASNQHRTLNCKEDNKLQFGKENNIIRLVTNEFFFYTKTPLTLYQFENLQQKIVALAKEQPENIHLVLGSFAVRTPDNKIMNVAPFIQCGANPIINFTVKNNPSSIDPIYKEETLSGLTPLDNITIDDNISDLKININGRSYGFEFNNLFKCKTADVNEFYCCIEICLDHSLGVAKKNLDETLNTAIILSSTPCSHIVISNSVDLVSHNSIGDITHADPYHSHKNCKQSVTVQSRQAVTNPAFGTPATIITTMPAAILKTTADFCNALSEQALQKVNFNEIQNILSTPYGTISSDAKSEIDKLIVELLRESIPDTASSSEPQNNTNISKQISSTSKILITTLIGKTTEQVNVGTTQCGNVLTQGPSPISKIDAMEDNNLNQSILISNLANKIPADNHNFADNISDNARISRQKKRRIR